MSTDWYTKLVLTVVAVCLALLVAQAYRGGAEAGASGSEEGRYRLTPIPMARMMIRFDSDTGRTWKATLPELEIWRPVADSPTEMLKEETEAPAPDVAAPEAQPSGPTIVIQGTLPAPDAKAPEAKAPEAENPVAP